MKYVLSTLSGIFIAYYLINVPEKETVTMSGIFLLLILINLIMGYKEYKYIDNPVFINIICILISTGIISFLILKKLAFVKSILTYLAFLMLMIFLGIFCIIIPSIKIKKKMF